MPSLDVKKYKAHGKGFLDWVNSLTVFNTMQIIVGAVLIFSVLYFNVLGFTRSFLLSASVTILGLLTVLSIVFPGNFKIPKTHIMSALGGIFAAVCLAGLFTSTSLHNSFIGIGMEAGTVIFIAMWLALIVIVASVTDSNKQIFRLLNVVVLSIGAAILMYIVNRFIFGGKIGFFINPINLGILSLLLVTMMTLTRQFFRQLCQYNIYFNLGTILLCVLGIVGLFITNDFVLWLIAGLLALASVTYALVRKNKFEDTPTPWSSVALFFIVLAGLFIGGLNNNWQDPNALFQGRPSFSSTMNVTRDALLESPLFGVGPNNFAYLWDQEKPVSDIVSQQGHLQYSFGFGYLPTFIATTGVAGLLALVTFLYLYVRFGLQVIRYIVKHKKDDPLTLITWMVSFVLILVNTVSVGDITILFVTAIMIGLAIASAVANDHLETITPELSQTYRKVPYQVILVTLIFIIFISVLYVTGRNLVASQKYRHALSSTDQLTSISILQSVVGLNNYDGYARTLAGGYTATIGQFVQKETTTAQEIQVLVNGALDAVKMAVSYNPHNYLNYRTAGDVYSTLAGLGVAGAYDEAVTSYNMALERKPFSSDVLLNLAQLSLRNDNITTAKQYAQIAFNVNPALARVYTVSAQIALTEQNLDVASAYLAQAARLESNNPRHWVDLGVVLFSNQQFASAAESFARAATLVPNEQIYYYLGITLKEMGRTEDVNAIYDLLERSGSQLPIHNLKTPEPVVVEVLENQEGDQGVVEEVES